MTLALAVHGLARHYGAVKAVDGIGFQVTAGEVFGLLGPNGAGKTTTLECILGLVRPDAGRIEIGGDADPASARAKVGAVLQATGLPDKITPSEALTVFGAFYPAPLDPQMLLKRFGLVEKANAAFDTLSGGQKQRLALALAFVGNPRLLLMDEPTTGLDPQMRREVQDHIAAIREEGRAVLLATHDMAEAERLCDRIAVIAQGRIIASGVPRDLIAASGAATLEEVILKQTARA
jgi:ABC-2 type transport system ATP-binding protein